MKKDLLLSRLTPYNDKAEMYAVWKASFKNIIGELSVSALEELELMGKWLGPESTKHANSIRSANINNPAKGLQRLWDRLDERYGSPEAVEASLMAKLNSFPKLTQKDNKRLYELSDILCEIESVKEDSRYQALLAYFDSSSGVLPILNKLPYNIQEKWTTRASHYKREKQVTFPPFTFFVKFIRELSQIKNDPSFAYDQTIQTKKVFNNDKPAFRTAISVRKTEISSDLDLQKQCLIHKTGHSLNQCRAFKSKPLQVRKKFINDNKICYGCCESTKHVKRTCTNKIKCSECGSDRHPAALHLNREFTADQNNNESKQSVHGGEEQSVNQETVVEASCTEICGKYFDGKSCAKILPVTVFQRDQYDNNKKVYIILDDQSNRSLASPLFFDTFGVHGTAEEYTLSSCSGRVKMSGRRTNGFVVESLDRKVQLDLPMLIECSDLPHNREEIPTPDIAIRHSHLKEMAHYLSPLDPDCEIMLLIGRDMTEAHHVVDQIIGPQSAPFAQKMPLGWVVIGNMCLDGIHAPNDVNAYLTHIAPDGRASILQPCPYNYDVNECFSCGSINLGVHHKKNGNITSAIFERTTQDDKPGLSIEDRQFLEIMQANLQKDSNGNWCSPLPFRTPRRRLPNNRAMVLHRAKSLEKSFDRDPVKQEHIFAFMQKLFECKHAELAPPLKSNEECWYLPVFGIYHPKKPDKVRCVFDSSASYDNVSLNSVMLRGPDMTNNLVGVLMRFRKELIGIMADIQQMFYSFTVNEEHRNFLRFLWYRDNDIDNELTDYRMRVHAFGNSPSPAIATFALQKTAEIAEQTFGKDVKDLVCRNFYVDDALTSVGSNSEAIDLLNRTKEALKTFGNLRLHKFSSNSKEVRTKLDPEDLAENLENLNFETDNLPLQRSLGLYWNLESDTFTFKVSNDEKAFTRRGVLSTINSIFDPLGFVSPVTIQGKIILRKLMIESVNWDEPLTEDFRQEWEQWRTSLTSLENVMIRRMYTPISVRDATKIELHTFCDASEKAIAAVSYLKVFHHDGSSHLGFVLGKTKLAPISGNTIPRLELCAAVLAIEISDFIIDNLDRKIDTIQFYSDSRIVLGYVTNQTRRFYTYVANRVHRIRKSSSPEQWNFVSTQVNPADQATRGISSHEVNSSMWILGPHEFISKCEQRTASSETSYPLVQPSDDKELRPILNVHVSKTSVNLQSALGSHHFERFSEWSRLVQSIAFLHRYVRNRKRISTEEKKPNSVELYQEAELFVIRLVQNEVYETEISNMEQNLCLSKNSNIIALNPYLDSRGVLCVGGRLNKSNLEIHEKNPTIIPGKHYIAKLLIRHYHETVCHQGRHFTEGALRKAGFWITGAKRLIQSFIHRCVTCRKLRGTLEIQKMADLPSDRLEPGPPFCNVGIDAFGPWHVVTRKTRGGSAQSKRWAILFSCLTTRAVHIEVVEEMSSSAFINALRRFVAIRGKVKIFRSDRGTNFVGSTDHLKIDTVNVENGPLRDFLYKSGTVWIFNPPHSSHMGGVWERIIGISRRILDSMLSTVDGKNLTHDVLVTFMAEVSAIINNRPLVPINADPESPMILSPSILLTQKTSDIDTVCTLNDFSVKDLYKAEWRRVQTLANIFWTRWREEYIQTLQVRRKWHHKKPNLRKGDVVLLRDKNVCRNEWPNGVVEEAFSSSDDIVRKVRVRVIREGKPVVYTRPVTELVLLFSE